MGCRYIGFCPSMIQPCISMRTFIRKIIRKSCTVISQKFSLQWVDHWLHWKYSETYCSRYGCWGRIVVWILTNQNTEFPSVLLLSIIMALLQRIHQFPSQWHPLWSKQAVAGMVYNCGVQESEHWFHLPTNVRFSAPNNGIYMGCFILYIHLSLVVSS